MLHLHTYTYTPIYIYTNNIHTYIHTHIDIRVALLFAVACARDIIQACSSRIHEHACRSARIRWTVGILHANLWLSALLPLQFRLLKCSVSNDFKILPAISTSIITCFSLAFIHLSDKFYRNLITDSRKISFLRKCI